MTREDARKFLGENATDEQVSNLLNAIGADIERARGNSADMQRQLDAANESLSTARQTIADLERATADNDAVRAELDRYRTAEQNRAAAENAAQQERAYAERFKAVSGNTQFVNSYTRDGVYAQFKAAIADAGNAGKGDADLFGALIKDKPDLVANPNPGINITGPNNNIGGTVTLEAFKAMPLHERMQWANSNPEAFTKLSGLLNNRKDV